MSKTKWYARLIYALVISLGLVAVPMAGTMETSSNEL